MTGFGWLVYGDGGVGKSWLAVATLPGIKLLIDAEGRTDNLPGEVVHWDGKSVFPTTGADATVVIPCRNGLAFDKIVSAVRSGKIPVKSVIVDSLTALQLNEIDDNYAGAPSTHQQWGTVLKTFAPGVMSLLQYAKRGNLDCVVLIAWHRESGIFPDVRITPDIAGALNRRISHLIDVVGYLKVQRTGQRKERVLQIEPINNITAKTAYENSLSHYNGFIKNPNLETLNKEMSTK